MTVAKLPLVGIGFDCFPDGGCADTRLSLSHSIDTVCNGLDLIEVTDGVCFQVCRCRLCR